ncbi:unnamed protein product [Allacma fusca]|uniref:Uncharacterized protein n=1 Tax=Allacma fusca TaxID=39272 RepID=A0A8J2KBU6_9HEXA|nr:unnamed protein product [Allacma fusca]
MLFYFAFMQLLGITTSAGAHRLWSHRTYKAKLPLRIFLMIFSTMSFQGPIHLWARWHRLHHKFSDTAGDPHNPTRGFFFSHMGWICMYDHQKFLNNSQKIIVTDDLDRDEVVMFQYRNYYWLVPLTTSLPTLIPWLLVLHIAPGAQNHTINT